MFDKLIGTIAQFCAERAWAVLAFYLIATLGGAYYSAGHLTMDTDTGHLVGPNESWRKAQDDYYRAFPQFKDLLVVVIDATTPDMAREATDQLQKATLSRPDLFEDVRQGNSGPFFDQYGMLFLPLDKLQTIINATIQAQPFLANLAADPSVRGLFSTLDLAFQGVKAKATSFDFIAAPLERIDETLKRALMGDKTPLSWQGMILNSAPDPRSLRHLLLVRPHQDFSDLEPAKAGMDFIRNQVKELHLDQYGVTVRLTGDVALEAEEFSSVAEGTGWALIVSIALVLGLLFLALRTWRTIVSTFLTLLLGLILTITFAALAIGSLNLISVAFAVMFIGLSIDFGIQFGVRFHQERNEGSNAVFFRTGHAMARPLTLAAFAIAVGFLSFLPTSYRGVSELGLIAGAGMAITLILNLTLLPALLALFKANHISLEMGYSWAAALDRTLLQHRKAFLGFWILCAAVGLIKLFNLHFDLNPLHLKDNKSESVSTLYDLAQDKLHSPYPINIVASSLDAAEQLKAKLMHVPEVGLALSANSLIPENQTKKIALLQDAQLLLAPSLAPAEILPTPDGGEIRQVLMKTARNLKQSLPDEPIAQSLRASLETAAAKDDAFLMALNVQLLRGFLPQLQSLKAALDAQGLSIETLPQEIRNDWLTPDGRALMVITPSGDGDSPEELASFVRAVQSVSAEATGPAVQLYESARAVVRAFRVATGTAILVIALLLFSLLRRTKDVLFVVLPLCIAASITALIADTAGLTLNFANIIALPLLLGIGVAFNIYFVVNWRRGVAFPLQTPTARAILFSALTTASSFASLALSAHQGTASMGLLLLIGLTVILATSLFFLPVLMGPAPNQEATL